jgi:hypothetical protein
MTSVTLQDVLDAARQIEGAVHRTPVLRSRTLDDLTGAEIALKAEHLQRIGAFKFRGASPGSPRNSWPRASPPIPPATTPRPPPWRPANSAAAP